MYLKTIELTGFKSFPDKTILDFTNGVTTIVGPNGSGKSNISDAIRWVLGETKAKSLRGGSMQDIIFSGTEKRKKLNFAEVSVIIDNSDKALPMDFNEIMVTRKVFRSGDSEYLINKTPCRMKDISELFMDTGLGKDGYSIVGQGKIDEIISGKPSDRRNFFEEAAGISKYRHKKDEAERKLGQTNDNLLRILDIVNELEGRLPALEKASKKAAIYIEIRKELKTLELKKWCYYIKVHRESLTTLQKESEVIIKNIEVWTNKINELDEKALGLSQKRRESDLLTEQLYKKEKDYEYNIQTYENQILLFENDLNRNKQDIDKLIHDKDIDTTKLDNYTNLIAERQEKINSLAQNKKNIEEQITAYTMIQEKIDRLKSEVAILSNEILAERNKKADFTIDRDTKKGKAQYLMDMEKNYEGYQKGIKEIFLNYKNNKLGNITIHGTLADIIKTNKETALAFDAVLGGTLQNVVVENENDAKNIIEFLKRNALGRVTFLPVNKIEHRTFDFGNALKEHGVVGKAVDLLSYNDKFKGIVSNLIGKTLIVEDYKTAQSISGKYKNAFRIVTLTGEVFNAGGSIVGGNILKNSGFMTKNATIESLRKEILNIEKQIIASITHEKELSYEIETKTIKIESMQDGLTEFNEKKAYLTYIDQAIIDETENQKRIIDEKDEYLKGFLEKEKEIVSYHDRNESILEDIEFKKSQIQSEAESLNKLRVEINTIKVEKNEIEEHFLEFQNTQKEVRDNLLIEEQKNSQWVSRIEKAEGEIALFSENLWESYELTYSQAIDELNIDKTETYEIPTENSEDKKKIIDLKSKIKTLGDISISSIEEYKEVNERYTFLNDQKNDLSSAKGALENLIDDMLSIMRTNFLTQFKLIDENFKIIFKELFGGGNASIKLLDETDILECGIEIIVQPPGKKLESISLLSGGEKAFTAIALLFAVLNLKPLPFCVFDEIEAALDDVNVYKFAEYIKHYKDKTQFILVSHRRGTMENADTLYGVTMQEKGISKLVSLDLNDIGQFK